MSFWRLLLPAVVIGGVVLMVGARYFQRHPEPAIRARFLRRTAFAVVALVTVFFGMLLVGETVDDPGGWAAVGWTAAWLAPLAALVLLARLLPSHALPVLVVLTCATVGTTVWAVAQSGAWRGFEDSHGPVRTVAVAVLSAAIAVYGLRHPRPAGWMLVSLGVLPLALSSLGGRLALGSLAVTATPAIIAGVLYVLAAHVAGRGAAPASSRAGSRVGVG